VGSLNEGKCCDAVLKVLEQRHVAQRVDVVSDTQAKRGIEVVCSIGGRVYGLEHTLIEPFPDNKADDIAFVSVFDGLEDAVRSSLLPDSVYHVWVDVYAFRNMRQRQLARIRQRLIEWVVVKVSEVGEPEGNRQTTLRGAPPEAPVRVVLNRMLTRVSGGRLLAGRLAPAELKQLRNERIYQALAKKTPKLEAAKRSGARSVLVLETADIALTNQGVVAEAIEAVSSRVTYFPDEIFLVDTSSGDDYYVVLLQSDGVTFPEVASTLGHWEFSAHELNAV
jgi:hypothetical protein